MLSQAAMDAIHLMMLVIALALIGAGCWLLSPAVGLIVVGVVLLLIVWFARMAKGSRNARNNQ